MMFECLLMYHSFRSQSLTGQVNKAGNAKAPQSRSTPWRPCSQDIRTLAALAVKELVKSCGCLTESGKIPRVRFAAPLKMTAKQP